MTTKNSNIYIKGSTFQEIKELYYFDKNIRSSLFSKIMEAESNLKSSISHIFCSYYPGNNSHTYARNFTSNPKLKSSVSYYLNDIIPKTISKNHNPSKPNPYNSIDHYMRVYGFVPLWVMVNYFTFGDMAVLYSILERRIQIDIARSFRESLIKEYPEHSRINVNPDDVISFLECLRQLRNRVAHDNCAINFRISESVKHNVFLHDQRSISKYIDRTSFYNSFIVLQIFLSRKSFSDLEKSTKNKLKVLSRRLNSISILPILDSMGIPHSYIGK